MHVMHTLGSYFNTYSLYISSLPVFYISCFCILNVYWKTHLHILIEIQFEGEKQTLRASASLCSAGQEQARARHINIVNYKKSRTQQQQHHASVSIIIDVTKWGDFPRFVRPSPARPKTTQQIGFLTAYSDSKHLPE